MNPFVIKSFPTQPAWVSHRLWNNENDQIWWFETHLNELNKTQLYSSLMKEKHVHSYNETQSKLVCGLYDNILVLICFNPVNLSTQHKFHQTHHYSHLPRNVITSANFKLCGPCQVISNNLLWGPVPSLSYINKKNYFKKIKGSLI